MLIIDSNENVEHEKVLALCTQVTRSPLNVHDFADYYWYAHDNHSVQVEHKQISEILGGLKHVEEQISRQLPLTQEHYLMYTGSMVPIDNVNTMAYKMQWTKIDGRNIRAMVPLHSFKQPYTGVLAWFDQLDKSGVTVVQVASEKELPMAIMALYNSSQKPEHETLKRYIKKKIHIKEKNPQVSQLLSIIGTRLNEDEAVAMIATFGTCWQVYNQDVTTLAKICGMNTASRLLKAIGRNIHV